MTSPPGRARLSTIPAATDPDVVTITMGIVLVACLMARIAVVICGDKHVDFMLQEFG